MKGYLKFISCLMVILLSNSVFSQTPGTLKWKYATSYNIVSSPAIGEDGTIYVGSLDDNLYAINPDGTKKWSFKTGDWVYSSPAVGLDGTIYVGSRDDNLYAVNPNGTQKWKFSTEGGINSSPAIGIDGTIYVGSSPNFYAINPDGTQKWVFSVGVIWFLDSFDDSSPAVGMDGTIYVGSSSNKLYAINPDGTQKWEFDIGANIDSSPAIGDDGTIYIGADDDYLYAINPDGTEKWKFKTGDKIEESSPAIGIDGTIYIGSTNGKLYAINADGTQKWQFSTGGNITSCPAVGLDGTIYVGNWAYKLYAINPDGTQKWVFTTGHNIAYSSSSIGDDGTVYVGCVDHNLYAINGNSGGLASSSWPKFHCSKRNLGRLDPMSNDVGLTVIDIDEPVLIGEPVQVTVKIQNFGMEPQGNFPVSYQINEEPPVVENFTGTLQMYEYSKMTFATTWMPSTLGENTIKAATNLTGDQVPANDTLSKTVSVNYANDVGVTDINLPDIVILGNSIPVEVEIGNFGAISQSNFTVNYSINNGPKVTNTFTGNLEAGDSSAFIFALPWIPQSTGMKQFIVWTELVDDQNSVNDTLPVPKDVFVRAENNSPKLTEIGNQNVVAGEAKIVQLSAIDSDGDALTFSIVKDPGFLAITGISQVGDTTRAYLVISPATDVIGTFEAIVQVSDDFTGTASITFTVQVSSLLLNPPKDLSAAFSENAVILNWGEPDILEISPYAGDWSGTTNQNLPINFHVRYNDVVETFTIRIKMDLISYYCTATFSADETDEIVNGEFETIVELPPGVSNLTATVHGALVSNNSASGTYAGEWGSFYLYCDGQFTFGTGNPVGNGTWEANKGGPAPVPPVLQSYNIYRSTEPNPWVTGTLIGQSDLETPLFTDLDVGSDSYYYQVSAVYDQGESDPSEEVSVVTVSVPYNFNEFPAVYTLEQNYPNPFNPQTTISFGLPKPSEVKISIFNLNGQLVAEIFRGTKQPGYHSIIWDASNSSAGTYFIKMVAGDFVQVKKCVLLK